MNATTLYYGTCNGQQVTFTRAQYDRPQAKYGEILPVSKNVRFCVASGGGKPPVYDYLVGLCACGIWHYVERVIDRPFHSSNHKCDARCQSAQGRKCECSCKGKNHGSPAN